MHSRPDLYANTGPTRLIPFAPSHGKRGEWLGFVFFRGQITQKWELSSESFQALPRKYTSWSILQSQGARFFFVPKPRRFRRTEKVFSLKKIKEASDFPMLAARGRFRVSLRHQLEGGSPYCWVGQNLREAHIDPCGLWPGICVLVKFRQLTQSGWRNSV